MYFPSPQKRKKKKYYEQQWPTINHICQIGKLQFGSFQWRSFCLEQRLIVHQCIGAEHSIMAESLAYSCFYTDWSCYSFFSGPSLHITHYGYNIGRLLSMHDSLTVFDSCLQATLTVVIVFVRISNVKLLLHLFFPQNVMQCVCVCVCVCVWSFFSRTIAQVLQLYNWRTTLQNFLFTIVVKWTATATHSNNVYFCNYHGGGNKPLLYLCFIIVPM